MEVSRDTDVESINSESPQSSLISVILHKQIQAESPGVDAQSAQKEAEIRIQKAVIEAKLDILQDNGTFAVSKADGSITTKDQPTVSQPVHSAGITENLTDHTDYIICIQQDLDPFQSLTQSSPTAASKDNEERLNWTHEAVLLLIDMRRKHSALFNNNAISMKHAWRKISEKMQQLGHKYSGPDCDKKFRNLKLRYKLTRANAKRTGFSKWKYFKIMHDLLQGDSVKETVVTVESIVRAPVQELTNNRSLSPTIIETVSLSTDVNNQTFFIQNQSAPVQSLLTQSTSQKNASQGTEERLNWTHEGVLLLVEMRRKHSALFNNNAISMKHAWRKISEKMQQLGHKYSGPDCDKKFRNLKLRYKLSRKNQKISGSTRWRYFDLMHDLLQRDPALQSPAGNVVQASTDHSYKRSLSPSTSLSNLDESRSTKRLKTSATDSVLPQLRQDLLRMHAERMELDRRKVEALERLVTILEKQ